MNSKKYLIFLLLFCVLFWLVVFFPVEIKLKGDTVVKEFVGNPVWQYLIVGIVIFIFGKKYMDSLR